MVLKKFEPSFENVTTKIGAFEKERMVFALASEKTLIPNNLDPKSIVEFILSVAQDRQDSLVK